MYVQRNIGARSRSHCCRGKSITVTHFECVSLAVVMQHAKRMRLLSSVARPNLQYFFTLSHKGHNFRRNLIEIKVCTGRDLQ
jgi:hypothetical protein